MRNFFMYLFTVSYDVLEHFHHIHSIFLQDALMIDNLINIGENWIFKDLDSSHQNVEFIPFFWILFNFGCESEEKVFEKVKFWVCLDYSKPLFSNFGNILDILQNFSCESEMFGYNITVRFLFHDSAIKRVKRAVYIQILLLEDAE